jgi:predicted NAD/FAD-binding protein
MNILQGLDAPETFCVTLNASERIDPGEGAGAGDLSPSPVHPEGSRRPGPPAGDQRHRRTYYCGAWWRNGFHEDGLVSALDALDHFRADFGLPPAPAMRPG